MNIQKKRLELHHVVKIQLEGALKECLGAMEDFKEELLYRGLYTTAPLIYRVLEKNPDNMKVEILLQFDKELQPMENDQFSFQNELVYEQCLYAQYLPEEQSESEIMSIMQEQAKQENKQLESPLYIILPFPGGNVMGVYAPIQEGSNDI